MQDSNKPLKQPLDYYDFHLRTLESMGKQQILDMMKGWPPHLDLGNKSREALASLLAESRAYQMLAMARPNL